MGEEQQGNWSGGRLDDVHLAHARAAGLASNSLNLETCNFNKPPRQGLSQRLFRSMRCWV